MDTISGLNAIKSVFAALGAKTSDSNYAVPLVDKTSAEPKGFMEMANLASVLGAARILTLTGTEDLDDCKDVGATYHAPFDSVAKSVTHSPFDHAFSVQVLRTGSGKYKQIATEGSTGDVKTRIYSGSWSAWTLIPSFYKNYSDLASLASALEVAQLKTQNDYTNIDSVHGDVNVNVAFTSTETQSAWGSPSRYGVLLCRKTGGKYEVQLYFAHGGASYGAPKMLYRTWNGELWGSWYSVAFQS